MASEILKRNPTSTGNRRVFTWAGWVKINKLSTTANCIWYAASAGNSEFNISLVSSTGALNVYDYAPSAYQYQYATSRLLRDFSNWFHLVVAVDTTQVREDDRFKIYINGVLYNGTYSTETVGGGINYQTRMNTPGEINHIGQNVAGGSAYDANCELTDLFLVDGQALTPDVFGFYKQGKGYISAGSTQATDFRPGQWVPKTPRVIKTEINRRGGFGVNGFYLPMNDSNNFGADFHCDPNSIITLNEKLPQPRVGVATTATAGIGFTDALREDPYAANLVLALPFVSSGLATDGTSSGTNRGFGDYSHIIRGSGSAKVGIITALSNVSIASTASYYGSAAYFDGSGDWIDFGDDTNFEFGSGDFTIEFWRKRLSTSSTEAYVAKYVTGPSATNSEFWFGTISSGRESFYWYSGASIFNVVSPSNTATIGQLDHIAAVRKSNVITLYVNGVAVGINTTVTYSLNASSSPLYVGGNSQGTGTNNYPFNGYLQDLRIYKGVAKYTGGFDVPRPYTPVGIATWRAVPDTTANNFATLNPLAERQAQKGTISAGNLRYDGTLNQQPEITSTVGVSTGKWYYEVYTGTKGDGGDGHFIGICNRSANSNGTTITIPSANTSGTRPTIGIANRFSTQLAFYDQDNTYDISGTSGWWADGSVVGFAFDVNNNSVSVYKNGVLGFTSTVSLSYVATGIGTTIGQGAWSPWLSLESSASRTPASNWVMNFGQNPTFSGNTTAGTFTDSNGKGLFKYQPPSGFLALCEDNLPTPAISDPGKYFKTVLYTGDGNTGRSIVGVGFTPDLVWVKGRTETFYHRLTSTLLTQPNYLAPNATDAEGTLNNRILSLNADGFTLDANGTGGTNASGQPYVAWCWRAGAGTTSTNTNGSITSVVSVNQDAGFSIVSYTGNGSASATIGHGLGKTPSFIITKGRESVGDNGWLVQHKSVNNYDSYMYLNATSAAGAFGASGWTPSNTTITLKTNFTDNNKKYIAYCWAEIEGFSKFGSYVGNGNADGPFVYCGFRPAWVLIKRATGGTGNWAIFDNSRDSTNPVFGYLVAESSAIEERGTGVIDFTSNGFKIRNSWTTINSSGDTIIFAAFAESPFTTANSK